MKVLVVGDACVSTGFARCTHAACDALREAGHEVDVLGINYYGDPHPYPYCVWPCQQPWDGGRDGWGVTRLPLMIERLSPDIVVILQDPWNIDGYLDALQGFAKRREEQGGSFIVPPIVGWLAVDAKNQRGDRLNELAHVIAWTRFGAHELRRGGYEGECSVVPLGVDLERFGPVDRQDARSAVLPEGYRDRFIVGVVGRNQPRKRLDLTIEYFTEWSRRLEDPDAAALYLHVAPTGEAGCDIRSLVRYHGLAGKVLMPGVPVGHGVKDDLMPLTYGAMDVLMTTTQGEGWGLPILEAMACGVPCVVPQWSALGDWAAPAAALVPCSGTALTAPMNATPYTVGGIADKAAFVEALDRLYREPAWRSELSRRGLDLAYSLPWSACGEAVVGILARIVAKSTDEKEAAA